MQCIGRLHASIQSLPFKFINYYLVVISSKLIKTLGYSIKAFYSSQKYRSTPVQLRDGSQLIKKYLLRRKILQNKGRCTQYSKIYI